MREVVLQLKAPHTWISEITPGHPPIRILDCKPCEGRGRIQQLVEVRADQNQLDSMTSDLKANHLVEEVHVARTERGRMFGSLQTESPICRTIMRTEAFCRSCLFQSEGDPAGNVEWTLAFDKREALTAILDGVKKERPEVKILKLSPIANVESLTPRQRSLVETALEEGFFDYPRRITLRNLAEKIGVSPATASEILRRAEKKILSRYQTYESIREPEEMRENLPLPKILNGRQFRSS